EEGGSTGLPGAGARHRTIGVIHSPAVARAAYRGIGEVAATEGGGGAVVDQRAGLSLEEERQVHVAIPQIGGEPTHIFGRVGIVDSEHVARVDHAIPVQVYHADVTHLSTRAVRIAVELLLRAEDAIRLVEETRPHRHSRLTLVRLRL